MLSSPAVANDVVYIGSNDYNLYALNAATGSKIWSYKTGQGVESTACVVNGVVYIGSMDNKVYAFGSITVPQQTSTSLSPNPTLSPTPTVPELSLLVFIALIVGVFSIAVILRHRKPALWSK